MKARGRKTTARRRKARPAGRRRARAARSGATAGTDIAALKRELAEALEQQAGDGRGAAHHRELAAASSSRCSRPSWRTRCASARPSSARSVACDGDDFPSRRAARRARAHMPSASTRGSDASSAELRHRARPRRSGRSGRSTSPMSRRKPHTSAAIRCGEPSPTLGGARSLLCGADAQGRAS